MRASVARGEIGDVGGDEVRALGAEDLEAGGGEAHGEQVAFLARSSRKWAYYVSGSASACAMAYWKGPEAA